MSDKEQERVEPTARPWEGRNDGLVSSKVGNVRFVLRIERHGPAATLDDEDRACMDLVLRAVNNYSPEQDAEIARLREALENLLAVAHKSSWAHVESAECGCKGCCMDAARAALTKPGSQKHHENAR